MVRKMTKQVVVFIHGIGEKEKGYSTESQVKIDKYFRQMLKKKGSTIIADELIFEEIVWADVTFNPQKTLDDRMKKQGLGRDCLRHLMITLVGDAIAYQKNGNENGVYKETEAKVQKVIEGIEAKYSSDEVEYTFVAHSLGSVVISNYLYDHKENVKATNLFTMGSPLAIWTLRDGDPDKATEPVNVKRPEGVWINILDDDDVLAYPLKPVNSSYDKGVDMDYVTEIGKAFSRQTFLSHTGYWSDRNALKPIAYKLAIDYLRIHEVVEYNKESYLEYIESLWNF